MRRIRSRKSGEVNLGFGGDDGEDGDVGEAGLAEAEPSVVEGVGDGGEDDGARVRADEEEFSFVVNQPGWSACLQGNS